MDETQSEPPDFGTHKLICLKYRWLGKDVHRAVQPVELEDGSKKKNFYVQESVGIATGFLIAALHRAGLATLTHTPSPMGFLREILGRGDNDRAFLILVTGYPADDAEVPVLEKKRLADVASFVE